MRILLILSTVFALIACNSSNDETGNSEETSLMTSPITVDKRLQPPSVPEI